MEIPFLGKSGPKIQTYLFRAKFSTYTNANMQNSMEMFTFSVLDKEYPFWESFARKTEAVMLDKIWYLIQIFRIQC